MNRIVRRHLSELERQRVVRLERFLTALVARAVALYEGEPMGDGAIGDQLDDLARRWVRWCADMGAFIAFGVRDGGDLVELPPLVRHGWPIGVVLADVLPACHAIAAGGTRSRWLKPRDLAMSGGAR